MSAVNEKNGPDGIRASKPDVKDEWQNIPTFSLIIFSLARFQFFLLTEI